MSGSEERDTDELDLDPESGRSVEELRDLRLLSLLRDLVGTEGGEKAAAVLGVSYRTVSRAVESDRLTPRMAIALERLLLLGGGAAAARERERMDALERRVGEVADGLREAMDRIDAVGAEVAAVREEVVTVGEEHGEQAQAVRLMERRLAGLEAVRQGTGAASAAAEGEQEGERPRYVPPRRYPQLVTKEAEEGEEHVYGEAAPVIVEWRRTYAEMMRLVKSGPPMRCNAVNERRLELEVALIEEHGLTLPPARYPWSLYDRQEQLWNRRQLLQLNRRERGRLVRRKWLLRLLTLGFWWE
ncbi:MAG: hypothetical protein F4X54_02785 [Chloroflexi bacterium]|nr:hypothetical protein [Chloroflexota bacterium]